MKLHENIALNNIEVKCKEKNYTFLGFTNDVFIGCTTKLILECNNCHNVWNTTSYNNFIHKDHGCPQCKKTTLKLYKTLKIELINDKIKAKCQRKNLIFIGWNNDTNSYKGYKTKLILKCNTCGNIWNTSRYDHFVDTEISCPECAKQIIANKLKSNLANVIKKANKIHNNIYDYSLIRDYKNNNTKYNIICKKHGVFKMDFTHHIDRGQGCPICNESKLEREIRIELEKNGIEYVFQKKIGNQKLDFFLPQYNIAIECQGKQHFEQGTIFEPLSIIVQRDIKKQKKASEQNCEIIYFTKKEWINENIFNDIFFQNIYTKNNIFSSFDDIINHIVSQHHMGTLY